MSCDEKRVFVLCLTVQSLNETQLTAGREAERCIIITAQSVAHLTVSTQIIIISHHLTTHNTKPP